MITKSDVKEQTIMINQCRKQVERVQSVYTYDFTHTTYCNAVLDRLKTCRKMAKDYQFYTVELNGILTNIYLDIADIVMTMSDYDKAVWDSLKNRK